MVNNNSVNSTTNDSMTNPKATKYSKLPSSGSGRKSSKLNSGSSQTSTTSSVATASLTQQSTNMGPMGINLIAVNSNNDGNIYIKNHGDENNMHQHQQRTILVQNNEK